MRAHTRTRAHTRRSNVNPFPDDTCPHLTHVYLVRQQMCLYFILTKPESAACARVCVEVCIPPPSPGRLVGVHCLLSPSEDAASSEPVCARFKIGSIRDRMDDVAVATAELEGERVQIFGT